MIPLIHTIFSFWARQSFLSIFQVLFLYIPFSSIYRRHLLFFTFSSFLSQRYLAATFYISDAAPFFFIHIFWIYAFLFSFLITLFSFFFILYKNAHFCNLFYPVNKNCSNPFTIEFFDILSSNNHLIISLPYLTYDYIPEVVAIYKFYILPW